MRRWLTCKDAFQHELSCHEYDMSWIWQCAQCDAWALRRKYEQTQPPNIWVERIQLHNNSRLLLCITTAISQTVRFNITYCTLQWYFEGLSDQDWQNSYHLLSHMVNLWQCYRHSCYFCRVVKNLKIGGVYCIFFKVSGYPSRRETSIIAHKGSFTHLYWLWLTHVNWDLHIERCTNLKQGTQSSRWGRSELAAVSGHANSADLLIQQQRGKSWLADYYYCQCSDQDLKCPKISSIIVMTGLWTTALRPWQRWWPW